MTSKELAVWFCDELISSDGPDQLRLAEALGESLGRLTDNERMDLYGKIFDVPDCPKAVPILNISNGNRPIDNALNFVTAKDTCAK